MSNKLPNGWKHTAIVDIADVNPKFDRKLFSDSIDVSFIPMKGFLK